MDGRDARRRVRGGEWGLVGVRSQRSRQSESQAAYEPPRAPRGRLNVPGELRHQARRRGSHHNVPIAAMFPPPRCHHHHISTTATTSSPPPRRLHRHHRRRHHPRHRGIPTTATASPCSTCRERGLLGLVVSRCVRGATHARGVRLRLHTPILPPTPPRTWGTARPPRGPEPGGLTSTR